MVPPSSEMTGSQDRLRASEENYLWFSLALVQLPPVVISLVVSLVIPSEPCNSQDCLTKTGMMRIIIANRCFSMNKQME
jgi:hypothetical protein